MDKEHGKTVYYPNVIQLCVDKQGLVYLCNAALFCNRKLELEICYILNEPETCEVKETSHNRPHDCMTWYIWGVPGRQIHSNRK
jgi:hypothetical protein